MGEHDSHGDCPAWTTLIIKNADGTSRDHQLVVDLEKDVAELKRCLRETYPGHPKEDRMKLVFSGRLIKDCETLYDLVKTHDPSTTPVMHLLLQPGPDGEKPPPKMPPPIPSTTASSSVVEPTTPITSPSPTFVSWEKEREGESLGCTEKEREESADDEEEITRNEPAGGSIHSSPSQPDVSPALAAATAAMERIAQQQQQQQQQPKRKHEEEQRMRTPPCDPAAFMISPRTSSTIPKAPASSSSMIASSSTPKAPSAASTSKQEGGPHDPASVLVLAGNMTRSVGLMTPGFAGTLTSSMGGRALGGVGFGAAESGLSTGVDHAALQEQIKRVYYEAYYKAYLEHFLAEMEIEENCDVEENEGAEEQPAHTRAAYRDSETVGDSEGDDNFSSYPNTQEQEGAAGREQQDGGLEAQNVPLFPGARARVDEQAELHARHEDLFNAGGRTLQLALKLVFVVFLLGQDAPKERLIVICILALCIFLHQTGFVRVFSWLYLPQQAALEDQYPEEEDEQEADREGGDGDGRVARGGGEAGFLGLLSDVTALFFGFFTSLIPRAPVGVYAN